MRPTEGRPCEGPGRAWPSTQEERGLGGPASPCLHPGLQPPGRGDSEHLWGFVMATPGNPCTSLPGRAAPGPRSRLVTDTEAADAAMSGLGNGEQLRAGNRPRLVKRRGAWSAASPRVSLPSSTPPVPASQGVGRPDPSSSGSRSEGAPPGLDVFAGVSGGPRPLCLGVLLAGRCGQLPRPRVAVRQLPSERWGRACPVLEWPLLPRSLAGNAVSPAALLRLEFETSFRPVRPPFSGGMEPARVWSCEVGAGVQAQHPALGVWRAQEEPVGVRTAWALGHTEVSGSPCAPSPAAGGGDAEDWTVHTL